MSKAVDYAIIGHGLAGAVFAQKALQRGKRIRVFDREDPATSSKIAAGIVNPITGARLAKSWRFDDCWPVAIELYGDHFRRTPILRVLKDEEEAERWQKRSSQPDFDNVRSQETPKFDSDQLQAAVGSFETERSGWLDIPRFLETSRRRLIDLDAYEVGEFHADRPPISASKFVWCQGFQGKQKGLFDFVPIRPGKGQILTLQIPNFDEKRIINRGKWLLPVGNGIYRAGATFEWDQPNMSPTPEGRAEVANQLREIIRLPFEVIDHQAAFRPMSRQGRPILGAHPKFPQHVIFNGFGAKGVLLAPFFADHLLDHLGRNASLDPEIDVRRFS